MEHLEYRRTLQQQNYGLKIQCEAENIAVHRLLEQCLDLSQIAVSQNSSQTNQYNNIDNLLQQKLTHQMQNLALQSSTLSQSIVALTNKLLSQQIYEAQSVQMLAMLYKYQQSILPLRNVLVQKQNQVYYKLKDIYQCFQDQYYNCVPKLYRLAVVQKNWKNKEDIVKQLKLLTQQRRYKSQAIFQDKSNQIDANKYGTSAAQKIMEVSQEHQDVQCTIQQTKQNNINTVSLKQRQLQLAHQRYGMSLDPKTYTSRSIKKGRKNNFRLEHQQQTTSMSLTKYQPTPSLSELPPVKIEERRKIPNFSHMSKHDFQLFQVYSNKICRQAERYQKLMVEYNNYRDVFKVIQQQNTDLICKLNDKKQREEKQQQSQDSQEYILEPQLIQQYDGNINESNLYKINSPTRTTEADPKQKQIQGTTVDQFTIRPVQKRNSQLQETHELNRLSEELDNQLKGLGGQDTQSEAYSNLGTWKSSRAKSRGKGRYTMLVRNQIRRDMQQQHLIN